MCVVDINSRVGCLAAPGDHEGAHTYPWLIPSATQYIDILTPWGRGRNFADDIFKCILINANIGFPLKISQKFVAKVQINNIPTLIQIMACRLFGAKPLSEQKYSSIGSDNCSSLLRCEPLSEPMMVSYLRIYESLGLSELNGTWRTCVSCEAINMYRWFAWQCFEV